MYHLPTWFLILSLFLPRVALFVEWLNGNSVPFVQPWRFLTWLCLPRVLILIMIYTDLGTSVWFWIHLVVAILAFLGGGSVARSKG
jgi:hypothetical protein